VCRFFVWAVVATAVSDHTVLPRATDIEIVSDINSGVTVAYVSKEFSLKCQQYLKQTHHGAYRVLRTHIPRLDWAN